jgi:alpha-L-fucosidase 2
MTKTPTASVGLRRMIVGSIVLLISLSARADTITAALALDAVSQYSGSWSSPPTMLTGGETTDAPLLGNGNIGVFIAGGISSMTFQIGKNEYWSYANASQYTMADMNLAVSGMSGASYSMKQVLSNGQVTGTFTNSGNTVKTTSWVQATDATNNLLITQIAYSGSSSETATVSFAPTTANPFPNSHGTSGSVVYMDIAGDNSTTIDGYATVQVRCAAMVVGATPTISNNQLTFTMQPGNTYTVVSCIMSNIDSASWQSAAISNISSLTASNITSDESSHESWWDGFWEASFVMLSDKTSEKEYYGSLYMLACASRTGHAPPGLWGPWPLPGSSTNAQPNWNGDYHTNYDYEVPYLGVLTANHPELLNSYSTPILNHLSMGESAATANGYDGVYYPVTLTNLPPPLQTNTSYLSQKSDAAYLAAPLITYYYVTKSTSYANTVLPYLAECSAFWTNYLSWNGSSYDDTNDAQQEGDAYPQTDGTMSLGLIHYLLQGSIAMANATNTDTSLVPTWTTYNNELAPYPTFTFNGVTCFRETSVGRSWNSGNDCECQVNYPANQIGLLSSSSLLSTSANTVTQYGNQGAWHDGNATPTFYPMAARLGLPASTILSNLDSWIASQAHNNLAMSSSGGGMENCNTVPAGLTEMMMQSFQGTILIFPDWPSNTYGKFGDLLAYGDFLISSNITSSGTIQYIRIISQAGGTATFQNPWPGQTLALFKNGSAAGTLSGTDISLSTAVNDVDLIAVNGTSYNTILNEMEANPEGSGTGGAPATNGLTSGNLSDALTTDGTTWSGGGIDGGGHSLSSTLLSSSIAWNGLEFNFLAPNTSNGASNETVTLPSGQFSTVSILAVAVNGNQTSQTFTVKYTNGTSTNFTQSMSDWGATPAGYSGESTAATMGYRDVSNGSTQSGTFYLHGYSFAINSALTVSSIVLPANANVVVVAIDLSGGAATNGLTSGNLADSLTNDGTTWSGGGIDGGGHSLSSTLLGSSLSWNGLTFTFLSPNTSNGASNETVTLPSGQFSTVSVLAVAVNGNQTSQTFTVKYTNGTSTNFTQSMSDWGTTPAGYSGESTAATMSHRDVNNGTTQSGTFYLHGYSFAINSSLTVSSIVLPANGNVVVVAIDLK